MRKEERILEDEADAALRWCELDTLPGVEEDVPGDGDVTGLGSKVTGDTGQQRALARPRRPDKPQGPTGGHLEIDVEREAAERLTAAADEDRLVHCHDLAALAPRRASHSESASAAPATRIERIQRRWAAASPPGDWMTV